MESQHYEKDFSKALLQLEQTGQATFTDFLEFFALSIRVICTPDQPTAQMFSSAKEQYHTFVRINRSPYWLYEGLRPHKK